MNIAFQHLNRYRFSYALVASLLFHFIIILLFTIKDKWIIFKEHRPTYSEHISKMKFEVIDTPDNSKAKKPIQKTFLLSNKNNRASDADRKKSINATLPFSRGKIKEKELDFSDYRESQSIQKKNNYMESKNQFKSQKGRSSSNNGSGFKEFNKKLLTRSRSHDSRFSSASKHANSRYNQMQTSVENSGGITFNTYDWEFAPYLLYLKESIQNNIYPPTSFTRLGFSGENIVTFKIYPDGKLEDASVEGFRGSEALVKTSVKAVEMSAPFEPLPKDFPEEFLIVTAKFSYYFLSNN